MGNRTSKDATGYSYDRADRITSAGGVSYTVDANGNLVARGADSFTYDQANRLKSAAVNGITSSFTYDGDGKRVSKTVGGDTTAHLYDVSPSLPVLLEDNERRYVWGLGLAWAIETGSTEGPTSAVVADGTELAAPAGGTETALLSVEGHLVYHADALGSVRAITDGFGGLLAREEADEYGVLLSGGSGQPFGYVGEPRDPETGFVYLRARMYDPATGRFLSRDPLPGFVSSPASQNPYAYAHNNPTTLTDPSGMNPAVGAVALACMASPACVIVVGATGTYLWWTHGGQEATSQLLDGISTWFAKQKGPEFRGKDARDREQAKIREVTRGMTPDQSRRFHDEVGKRKRAVGGGGAHNLSDDELEEVRDHILGGGY